jgi:hypothetical protein
MANFLNQDPCTQNLQRTHQYGALDALDLEEGVECSKLPIEVRLSKIRGCLEEWEILNLIRVLNTHLNTTSSLLSARLRKTLSQMFYLVGVDWSRLRFSLERQPMPHDYCNLTLFYNCPGMNKYSTFATCGQVGCKVTRLKTHFLVYVVEPGARRLLLSLHFHSN